MPSTKVAGSLPSSRFSPDAPAQAPASPAAPPERSQSQCLADASRALWLATLSLMTAFMQNQAPAHRCLLARRISRNLDTLSRQDCFAASCRASFGRLALRWQARSEQCAPESQDARAGVLSLFS